MKTRVLILAMASIFLSATFHQCKKDEDPQPLPTQESALPANFKVDIPSSLSNISNSNKRTNGDTLKGEDIYQNLNTFIYIGEASAQLVEDIIMAIGAHGINHAMSISFVSDDDQRTKNLVVVENTTFENKTWEFELTVTDAASEGNADGGKALQVFWNRNPVDGISILKPFNIDRVKNNQDSTVMYRVDYSETGLNEYEKYMIVAIDDITMPNPLTNPFAISTLKMFVGKNGNIINIYGNSNHPFANFHSTEPGFNWAFVASGKEAEDIGVAEVGLPPSSLDETSRTVLLKTYSIKNVLTDYITYLWPSINQSQLASYLQNAQAPGYFDTNGFVQGGTSPGNQYNELETQIAALTPYNPKDILNLSISFK